MALLSDLAQLLPHRPPFLLVDRITHARDDQLIAERRLCSGDPLLAPDGVLPGPLVIEALCQAAACLNGLAAPSSVGAPHRGYLVAVSDFHFRGQARAGETLVLQVTREARRGAMHAFTATALSGQEGRPIAAGRLLFAVGTS